MKSFKVIFFLILSVMILTLACEGTPVEENALETDSTISENNLAETPETEENEEETRSNRKISFSLASFGRVKITDIEEKRGKITAIPYKTTLKVFKEELILSLEEIKATFQIYDDNNQEITDLSGEAFFLEDNFTVEVTSEDESLTITFLIDVKSPSAEARLRIKDKSIISDKKNLDELEMLLITGVIETTSLEDFRRALDPFSAGATFEIYEPDGVTLANSLISGSKVITTAEDGKTQLVYTVLLAQEDGTTIPLEIVNEDGTISQVGLDDNGSPQVSLIDPNNPYGGVWSTTWNNFQKYSINIIDEFNIETFISMDLNQNFTSDAALFFTYLPLEPLIIDSSWEDIEMGGFAFGTKFDKLFISFFNGDFNNLVVFEEYQNLGIIDPTEEFEANKRYEVPLAVFGLSEGTSMLISIQKNDENSFQINFLPEGFIIDGIYNRE